MSEGGKLHDVQDPGSALRSDDSDTYEEDRRTRLHRNRLVGFSVCGLVWALSVVPLALESMDGREGAGTVAGFLAVAAISLGVAAVIRGVYVWLRNRRFWSPWVFLIAALLAVVGWGVQSAGDKEIPIASTPTRDASGEAELPGS